MASNLKMAGRRTKGIEVWDSGMLGNCILGTSDLLVCKVILGSFGECTFLEMACNLKMAARRAKRIEVWDSGAVVVTTWDNFDLVVFNIILWSFGAPVITHKSNWSWSKPDLNSDSVTLVTYK